MEIVESEVIYARAGDVELKAVLYQPGPHTTGGKSSPMLIDVHGGAWSSGHRKSGRYYDRQLAAAGITILAIDFRQGPDYQHPAASCDICAAVRFARNTYEFTSIGLIGSSSGGHLALLSALKPDIPDHCTTDIADKGSFRRLPGSAKVDFVVALWPVSNPIARYQYVLGWEQEDPTTWGPRFQPDRLAEGHRAYYSSTDDMSDASIQRILNANEHQYLPPVFIVQPALDQNVPVFMSETLRGAIIAAGGTVRYKVYPDVAHGFAQAEGPQTAQCIADILEFIPTV